MKESQADLNEKSGLLMGFLHDMKHECSDEILYNRLAELFPNWREVESFDPNTCSAFDYLFHVVLMRDD